LLSCLLYKKPTSYIVYKLFVVLINKHQWAYKKPYIYSIEKEQKKKLSLGKVKALL